jgi:hypothetical protein
VPEVEACFLHHKQMAHIASFSLQVGNFLGLLQELVRPELELQSNPKATTTMQLFLCSYIIEFETYLFFLGKKSSKFEKKLENFLQHLDQHFLVKFLRYIN